MERSCEISPMIDDSLKLRFSKRFLFDKMSNQVDGILAILENLNLKKCQILSFKLIESLTQKLVVGLEELFS